MSDAAFCDEFFECPSAESLPRSDRQGSPGADRQHHLEDCCIERRFVTVQHNRVRSHAVLADSIVGQQAQSSVGDCNAFRFTGRPGRVNNVRD